MGVCCLCNDWQSQAVPDERLFSSGLNKLSLNKMVLSALFVQSSRGNAVHTL